MRPHFVSLSSSTPQVYIECRALSNKNRGNPDDTKQAGTNHPSYPNLDLLYILWDAPKPYGAAGAASLSPMVVNVVLALLPTA